MRIIYVEDNIANVFLVQRVAKMGKHEVIHYIDGDEFLRKYESADPHLILMDIQLAGNYSGLDLVRKLRESGNNTPIIAVTAYAMVGDRERCLRTGCNEYIAKPLSVTQMVDLFTMYSQQTEQSLTDAAPAADDEHITHDRRSLSQTGMLDVSLIDDVEKEAPDGMTTQNTPIVRPISSPDE